MLDLIDIDPGGKQRGIAGLIRGNVGDAFRKQKQVRAFAARRSPSDSPSATGSPATSGTGTKKVPEDSELTRTLTAPLSTVSGNSTAALSSSMRIRPSLATSNSTA
jgi:hypothetical protein